MGRQDKSERYEIRIRGTLSEVVAALDAGCSAADALKTVTREALRGARWPERSTSASSNRLSQAKTAAYADAIEKLEWLAKLEAEHAAYAATGEK